MRTFGDSSNPIHRSPSVSASIVLVVAGLALCGFESSGFCQPAREPDASPPSQPATQPPVQPGGLSTRPPRPAQPAAQPPAQPASQPQTRPGSQPTSPPYGPPTTNDNSPPPYGQHVTITPPPAPSVPMYPIKLLTFQPGRVYFIGDGYGSGVFAMFGSSTGRFQRHMRDWYWGSFVRRRELARIGAEQGYPYYNYWNFFNDNTYIQGRMGSDYWYLDLDQMTVRVAPDQGGQSMPGDPSNPAPQGGSAGSGDPNLFVPFTQGQEPEIGMPLQQLLTLLVAQDRSADAVALLTDLIAADEGIYSPALMMTFLGYLRLSLKDYRTGSLDMLDAATLDATAMYIAPPPWMAVGGADAWQITAGELVSLAGAAATKQEEAALRFTAALIYAHTNLPRGAERQLAGAEAAGLNSSLANAARRLISPTKAGRPAATPAVKPPAN